MHARSTVRGAVAPAAALLLPLGMAIGVAAPASAESSGADAVSSAPAAAGQWLLDQAVAEDGQAWDAEGMPSQSQSLDSVIGLMSAGYGSEQIEETMLWLDSADVLDDYLAIEGGGLDAGALGKTLLTVAAAGGDINDFGGVDLEGSLIAIQDEDDGVFDPTIVGANAWAILGLNAADSDFDDAAYDALADSQCDDGSFAFEGAGDECFGDPDTTGIVITALATGADDNSDALEAAESAGEWLLGLQGDDGGVGMEGMGTNANSTAMTAQAMLALAEVGTEDAEEYTIAMSHAVNFLLDLQIDCSEENTGAIRYQAEEDEDWMEGARTKATSDTLLAMGGQTLASLDGSATEAGAPDYSCGNDANAEAATEDEDESSTNWLLWALIVGGIVIVFVAIAPVMKFREKSV